MIVGVEALTPRQVEILQLMADGLMHKEIAERLGIGLSTVKNFSVEIRRRLEAVNMPHAVSLGIANNYIKSRSRRCPHYLEDIDPKLCPYFSRG